MENYCSCGWMKNLFYNEVTLMQATYFSKTLSGTWIYHITFAIRFFLRSVQDLAHILHHPTDFTLKTVNLWKHDLKLTPCSSAERCTPLIICTWITNNFNKHTNKTSDLSSVTGTAWKKKTEQGMQTAVCGERERGWGWDEVSLCKDTGNKTRNQAIVAARSTLSYQSSWELRHKIRR